MAALKGEDVHRYRYDGLGNRIGEETGNRRKELNETLHSYNKRNQLIKTTEGEAVREYDYDRRGNLTAVTENGQLKARYEFDAANMMTGAFTPGKGKAEYTYNGFRNRVRKLEQLTKDTAMPIGGITDPTSEIRYTLDMTLPYDNLLAVSNRYDQSQNQSFIWGNGLIEANGKDGRNSFYYLQDHLGSPIRLMGKESEESSQALAYDEFGVPTVEAIQQGAKFNQPFGFTGYQTDDVSGMYYAQARYYEPKMGRFGAEDSHWNPGNMVYGDEWTLLPNSMLVPQYSSISQSGNLYSYAMNSPVIYTDPLGELLFPGQAHNWVSKHIVDNNSRLTRERWMNVPVINANNENTGATIPGRVDILDPETGSIWEIKPEYWNTQLTIAQLQLYTRGTFMHEKLKKLTNSIHIYSGSPEVDGYRLGTISNPISFPITQYENGAKITYEVKYWYSGSGIINYNYRITDIDLKALNVGVFVFLFLWGLYEAYTTGRTQTLEKAFQKGATCFGF